MKLLSHQAVISMPRIVVNDFDFIVLTDESNVYFTYKIKELGVAAVITWVGDRR